MRWDVLSSRRNPAELCATPHPFTHQEVVFGPGTASDPVSVTGREGANQNRGFGCPHIPAEQTLDRPQERKPSGP